MMTDRNADFLKLARRARTKWILDSLDMKSLAQATKNVNNNIDNRSIPGVECIQNTLNYLTDIIGDGSAISVDSLLLGLNDYDIDDNDDDNNGNSYNNDNWSPYLQFIAKLRHPGCKEIVKSMQQFVSKFEGKYKLALESKSVFNTDTLDDALDATHIWNFIDHIESEIKLLPIFVNDEKDTMKENCERFIFIKLYNCIFDNDYDDRVLNEKLRVRIESLSFLSPEHLDIKSLSSNDDLSCLSNAIEEIKLLNEKKSPIDKIQCIKKCSIAIGDILKSYKDGQGADEFLPVLILIIAKSNPLNLHSNLKFLQKYTHPSKLVSEVGYLLTHFICAAHFLDNVDANALTISPSEFEKSMTNCKVAVEMKTNDMKSINNSDMKTPSPRKSNNNKNSTLEDVVKKIPDISIKEYIQKRKQFMEKNVLKS